eukprot:scaffold161340_cov30-Tisochrysis_lutea.AAC.1
MGHCFRSLGEQSRVMPWEDDERTWACATMNPDQLIPIAQCGSSPSAVYHKKILSAFALL